jgi:hypothetical protein
MDENQDKQDNLLDTTDCLEAVGVFRAWKNGLFVITVLCLVLLQILFWIANLGVVMIEEPQSASAARAAWSRKAEPNAPVEPGKIAKAARQVTAEPNQPGADRPLGRAAEYMKMEGDFAYETKSAGLAWLMRSLIRLLDFVLILAAILYCLTILFSLKISLLEDIAAGPAGWNKPYQPGVLFVTCFRGSVAALAEAVRAGGQGSHIHPW